MVDISWKMSKVQRKRKILPAPKNVDSEDPTNTAETAENPRTRKRTARFNWKNCISYLLEWISTEGNYDRWKSTASNGDSKVQVAAEIASQLVELGFAAASGKIVQNKIENLEISYRKARSCLKGTGYGVDDQDLKRGINTIEAKVEILCPNYDVLDPVFGERPCMVPPFAAGSTDDLAEVIDEFAEVPHSPEDENEIIDHDFNPEDVNDEDDEIASGLESILQQNEANNSPDKTGAADVSAFNEAAVTAGPANRIKITINKPAKLAPSQQKALTNQKSLINGKRATTTGGQNALDGYLKFRFQHLEQQSALNVRRQEEVEKNNVREHEVRMAEIKARELEAAARLEEAKMTKSLIETLLKNVADKRA